MRPTLPIALAALILASPAPAATNSQNTVWGDSYGLGSSNFEHDFDENAKPWQEIQALFPAYPKEADLIPFEVSAATSNRHFVDFASVSLGSDAVVRYSVVIRSASGAENVSFEGMRCDSGERKLYAFGRKDGKDGGTWSRNRYARWEVIKDRQQTGYHRELFYHYFCTVEGKGDLKKIHYLLKSGGLYIR